MIRIAAIGYGGFGSFVIRACQAVPDVSVVVIAGTNEERAHRAAETLGVPRVYTDYVRMLDDVDCDLVLIQTPPYLHKEQFLECVRRRRHVICEKPIALTLEDADRMISEAAQAEVVATVNHMMRYSPVFHELKRICDSRSLGSITHLSLHNHANARGLREDHWFWDEQKSGGVLVEHGVHFYDMYSWIAGETMLPLATYQSDPGQVWSIGNYPSRRITADFYHHFDRTIEAETNFGTVLFEDGFVRFDGWIPLRLIIRGSASEDTMTIADDKESHYSQLIQDLLRDVLARIHDQDHELRVTLQDARSALSVALRATSLRE